MSESMGKDKQKMTRPRLSSEVRLYHLVPIQHRLDVDRREQKGLGHLDSIAASLFENNWLSRQIVIVSDDKIQKSLFLTDTEARCLV